MASWIEHTSPQNKQYDAYLDDNWVGYVTLDGRSYGLERCPKCRKENYAMAVLSGVCAWCGHDANERLSELAGKASSAVPQPYRPARKATHTRR